MAGRGKGSRFLYQLLLSGMGQLEEGEGIYTRATLKILFFIFLFFL